MKKKCLYGHTSGFYKSGNCIDCTKNRSKKLIPIQNKKRRKITQEILQSIVRVCKRRLCDKKFTPKKRKDQVYCSILCNERQAKEDWKKRNKKKYSEMEQKRKGKKYKEDPEYRNKQKKKSLKIYHSLNDDEKLLRNQRNRLRADPINRKNYHRKYQKLKYQDDVHHRIGVSYRSRVRAAVKAKKTNKKCKSEELLGCTILFFRKYLQKQFEPGMSWDNFGKWHMDHIIPVKAFHLKTEENQKNCFNYKNFRPLWAIENLRKGAKY